MYESLNEATAFTDRAIYRLVPVRTITESWTVEIYISYTLLLMDPDQLNFGIRQFETGQISTV